MTMGIRSQRAEDFEVVISRLRADEGGGYLAKATELPGCMSDGNTRAEAAHNIDEAIDAWIATAIKIGRPIPKPRRNPA